MEVNIYKSNSLLDKKGIDNFTKKGVFKREGGILLLFAPVIVYFWNSESFLESQSQRQEAYKLQALIGTSCFSYRVSRET